MVQKGWYIYDQHQTVQQINPKVIIGFQLLKLRKTVDYCTPKRKLLETNSSDLKWRIPPLKVL
jgi:hypothetical protein